jgi:predicted GNAT family acetyltransferase
VRFFGNKKPASEIVMNGRFEVERAGQVAYLEYALDSRVLTLIHSEIPEGLRGEGVASELARTALEWARENHKQVDVECPFVAGYIKSHPEYADLVVR